MCIRDSANIKQHIVVVGAGIVGVSAAIWLARAGRNVTLLDRLAPGEDVPSPGASRSSKVTFRPARASQIAADTPTIPAPTTTICCLMFASDMSADLSPSSAAPAHLLLPMAETQHQPALALYERLPFSTHQRARQDPLHARMSHHTPEQWLHGPRR